MSAGADAPPAAALLRGSGRRMRALITPDGVPLRIEVADLSERAAAFSADFVISSVAAMLVLLVALLIAGGRVGGVTVAAALFAGFVIRNAYFIAFELAWAGVTPGKRAVGLRVIDRNGGALTTGAVVARNLTREAELFFPLGLVAGGASWVAGPWEIVPAVAWLVLTSLLPLCNRDRLRAGDLLGGTIVIAMPKRLLLEDLLSGRRQGYEFSGEQLQRYGILELQVLEDVLRRSDAHGADPLLIEIGEKIRRKIEWSGSVPPRDAWTFLRDFYAAQRAFLEQRKHLGEERADKFHAASSERRG